MKENINDEVKFEELLSKSQSIDNLIDISMSMSVKGKRGYG